MFRDICYEGLICDFVGLELFFRCVCFFGKIGVRCDVDVGNYWNYIISNDYIFNMSKKIMLY